MEEAHLLLLPPHSRPSAVHSAAPGGVPCYECLVNHPGCAVAVLVDSPDSVVCRCQTVTVVILASPARAAQAEGVSHSLAFGGIDRDEWLVCALCSVPPYQRQ